MALDTRGLVDGAVQGFGLMDRYYRGQNQDERAERRLGMQEETFEMQKGQAEKANTKEQATFVLGKIAQGVEPSEDEYAFLKEHPQFWPALDEQTDKDIEIAQRVLDPEDKLDANSEEALYSLNHMFGSRINRGEGGKKRIAGIYPGKSRPDAVAIDLEVEGEDGSKRNAPMTRNRGIEGDDEVLETPVEELVNQVQGYRLLRNAFRTPEAQATASKVLAALTGKSPERSTAYTKRQEMLGLGVGPDEATKNAYGLKAEDERYGEPFQHPQLGWVQPGPDGKLQQLDSADTGDGDWRKLNDGSLFNRRTGETMAAGGEAPNDGTGGLDSSVMSQIQQTARNFHGSFNPDGSFMGIPAGAREKYTMAMERAQELIAKGNMSVFEATNLANLSVSEKLSESDARRLAEQEAEQEVTGWFKGDEKDAFVKRRTQELLDESKSAQQRYEQIVGGNTQKASPANPAEPDMQQANQIKADYKAGKISREQAASKLRSLGFQ